MKTRPFKMLGLALTLPLLAGCAIIDNILGSIALNVVFESELLLNRVSMTGGEADVGAFPVLPDSAEKRADLTYGLDALVVPSHVAVNQMGFTVEIDFEITFSEGAANLFFVETMEIGDDEEAQMEAAAQMLYPIGTQEKPTSVDAIGDWLNIDRLLDLKNETATDVSITIKGTSGNSSKSRTFYFNLNSELINLPGGGDVDIDSEHALIVDSVGVAKTFTYTIPKENLLLGHEIPLQVLWVDLGNQTAQSGHVTITTDLDLEKYELTTIEDGLDPIAITKNETIIVWTNTVKLKDAEPAPAEDLVITYTAVVAVLAELET